MLICRKTRKRGHFVIVFLVSCALLTGETGKASDNGQPLAVTSVLPNNGPVEGRTHVIIRGAGFDRTARVTIGGIPVISRILNETMITTITPPRWPGFVDVTVRTDRGSATLQDSFEFWVTTFIDATTAAGAAFRHRRDARAMPLGGGTAVADYDNDGHQDIYVTNSAGPNALYRNNGDGTFSDVATSARVDDPTGVGHGACFADFDNDGDSDLFVANYGSSRLFRNNGNGTFSDFTTVAGVGDPDSTFRSTGCAWGDYDRDGFLDLIVVRHLDESDLAVFRTREFSTAVRPLALYHNNRDGTFTNLAGLLGPAHRYPSKVKGAGFQPGFVDYDNDGDADIYVVNDFGGEIYPNVLWRNEGAGPNGTWFFTDVSATSGANVALFGMCQGSGDYDLNGFLDFYMTNIGDNQLLRSNGNGTFTNATAELGVGIGRVGSQLRVSWGCQFFDYDNDGDEDLYVVSGFLDSDPSINPVLQPNVLFRNNGDGSFTNVGYRSGADDPGIGRGSAYADFNGDGCLDLYVVNLGQVAKLFQNRCDSRNNWLIIRTVGTVSNRDGIGARVRVVAGGLVQIREVRSGSSHMSGDMLPPHFGLGNATRAELVEIRWPSGQRQMLFNVGVNQTLTVTEPSSPAGSTLPSTRHPIIFKRLRTPPGKTELPKGTAHPVSSVAGPGRAASRIVPDRTARHGSRSNPRSEPRSSPRHP